MRQFSPVFLTLALASSACRAQSAPDPTSAQASVTVKTVAALNSAIKSSHAGETILLEPGVYSGVAVRGLTLEGVTIASADPKTPATLTGFYMDGSHGLTLANLVLSTEGSVDPYPFRVGNSSNIVLANLSVHGSMDGNPQNDQSGIYIGNSDHITVKASEFQELLNGIVHANASDILIDGNYIHDIGTDGIHGGGTSNITISNNHVADLHALDGQHPDAIQFWTVNTKESATNINVTGNLLERGTGGILQGVFLGNEANIPYKGVVISSNTVVGGMYNGVALSDAEAVTITGNSILAFDDQQSWLVLRYVTNTNVTGNQAEQFTYVESAPTQAKNTVTGSSRDKGAAAIAKWKAAHAGAVYGIDPARK